MSSTGSLSDRIVLAPASYDGAAAARLRDDLGGVYDALPERARQVIDGAAGCSPYLKRLILRRKDDLAAMFAAPPEVTLDAAMAAARAAPLEPDPDAQMRILRAAKEQAALVIALADLGGAYDVMQAASALSHFADAAVEGALGAAAARAGLEGAKGVAVLAMGKQGAFELNYSSDIDLIVLFDDTRMGFADAHEAQKRAVAATRDMVKLLQTQTADGYVFRTDLRLRPDPGFTAPAVSVRSAEAYYEAYGQNWERMAFIKARACAGDIALGETFLKTLRPYIWRKFLDFAAIEDVHAVKRQMHSAKGGGEVAFEGHDVKLGRGGIREIEFYAQTQQLILGGKNEALRPRATLDALSALTKAGVVSEETRAALSEAYRYFRHVEHRVQMVNDEQTHRLPTAPEEIDRLAVFSGAASTADFRDGLLARFHAVGERYDELFAADDVPESRLGPLVFTGVDAHPATLETLKGLGFKRGEDVSAAIQRWHRGSLRATRSERARGLLTKLVPPLLEALSKAAEPDEAFFAFEDFLEQLPAGVQIFSLFLNNLHMFDALIRIMTISPFLGREFSKRVNLVEKLLDNRWADAPPALTAYAPECKKRVTDAGDYEAALNAARRWAGEQKFQITAQLAVGLMPAEEASAHFTAIADAAILALYDVAMKEMAAQHGAIAGECAVIGLGRLGSSEMTATSDIDLMFVYDAPDDAQSDGARALGPVDYYARFVRRAVTALSAATEEGALYEVDMQLRPSGKAGPAAVRFPAFEQYYREEAWTWEAMALVKARVIGPDSALAEKVKTELGAILTRPRERARLARDAASMRVRLDGAKPGAGPWDVKNIIGGLTDIAFICQFLALATGARIGPAPAQPVRALQWFENHGELSHEDAAALTDAQRLYEAVLQVGRAATGGAFAPDKAGEALRARMASVCGKDGIAAAEEHLARMEGEVARLFTAIVGERRAHDDN
ncbi:MAG: bifunctional [glutamine synthetase] adenylyltransferase/[glutamine synthetase]-adenylyl-L-tyrosine phosphorylase [Parvularculaceae bacterium]